MDANNNAEFNISEVKDTFISTITKIEERIKLLEEKEAHWMEIDKKMQQHADSYAKKIVLDVGMFSIYNPIIA